MFGLSAEQLLLFVFCLCEASKKNRGEVELNTEYVAALRNSSSKQIDDDIQALTKAGVLTANRRRKAVKSPGVIPATNVRTNDTYDTNVSHAKAFELFWSGYPNKKGKTKSESTYKKLLASGVNPEALLSAREKYREQLKREGTEAKYILHGPTFLNRYKDFLDPDYGKAEDFSAAPAVDFKKIAEGR